MFPYRLPGLTVLNDAPISAQRGDRDAVHVKLPVRVLGTDAFREETDPLPPEVFTSGIDLPENEIVGVRLYDLGGAVVYRPALFLVQLSNETDTTILTKIAEAAGIGLSLGAGELIGLGVEASAAGPPARNCRCRRSTGRSFFEADDMCIGEAATAGPLTRIRLSARERDPQEIARLSRELLTSQNGGRVVYRVDGATRAPCCRWTTRATSPSHQVRTSTSTSARPNAPWSS